MHQEGFISVFSDILYDDHSPSVGPRGIMLPLGVVMIIVGSHYQILYFFSCASWLKYCPRSYNLFIFEKCSMQNA